MFCTLNSSFVDDGDYNKYADEDDDSEGTEAGDDYVDDDESDDDENEGMLIFLVCHCVVVNV